MTLLKNTGLVLCLSVSALLSSACNDDDDANTVVGDAGADGGTHSDASVAPRLDAGLDASIDSSIVDASGDAATPATDAATAGGGASYTVTLTPGAEKPTPCAQAGAAAAGTAVVLLNEAEDTLVLTITYSGLSGSGEAKLGHIHYGAADTSGPVVLPFSGSLASPIIQTLTAANYTSANGQGPATFAAFVSELKAGKAYVNLHTEACGGGEIRGQIQ